MRPVVFCDRRGLLAIDVEPGLEDLGIIVAAYGLAFVCGLFGAPPDAIEQRIFVDFQLKHRIELDTPGGEFLIERFGLRDGARKAVKYKAVCRVGMVDTVGDNRNHDIVGHQFAAIHDVFDAQSGSRAFRDGVAQHVAGRQLRDRKAVDNSRCLRAFPGARRS